MSEPSDFARGVRKGIMLALRVVATMAGRLLDLADQANAAGDLGGEAQHRCEADALCEFARGAMGWLEADLQEQMKHGLTS